MQGFIKAVDFVQESLPGWLAFQQDMILAFERHEPRAGDQRG